MKRLVYVLIVFVSVSIFSTLFIQKNIDDVSLLSTSSYSYVEKISDRKGCKVEVSLTDREINKIFLDRLLNLAKENDYIVTAGQSVHLDGQTVKTIYYIYDQENRVIDELLNDFGNGNYQNQDIISTENCLQIINHYFMINQIFEYKNFDYFMDEVYTVNDVVSYNIFSYDKDLVEKQIYEISDGLMEIYMEDSWEYQKSEINQILVLFMIISAICLIISIIHLFLHEKKEIDVAKLLGYNFYEILKKYLFRFLGLIALLFAVCHVLLCFLFIECLNGMAIEFIKDLILKDIIFIIFLFLLSVLVFLIIIKNMHLKKSVSYQPLLNFVYCLKVVCIFIFCFIFSSSYQHNKLFMEQAIEYLKCSEFCEDYYIIQNLVGKDHKNLKVEKELMKVENILACSSIYMDPMNEDEIPFIIANENYVHIFNDDQSIKENILLVPERYKNLDLREYKLKEDVEVKYIDYTCTYDGLAIDFGIVFENPIVFVINDAYFSWDDFMLPNDKSIEEYHEMVSQYVDAYEMRIEDATAYIDDEIMYIVLPILIEMIFYSVLFICSFVMIIYIFMKLYFEQYNKEIAVKNLLGYRFLETYHSIYVIHLMAYILPLILVYFMLNDMQVLILFFVMTFGFDFIVQTILLNINHRKSKLMLLKDGE